MKSAFGVEHGEIHKGPYPGGQWGANATPEAKKKTKRRFGGVIAAGGTGGALIGGLTGSKFKSKTSAVGAGIAGAGLATHVIGTRKDVKRGVIKNPYKVSKGFNPLKAVKGLGRAKKKASGAGAGPLPSFMKPAPSKYGEFGSATSMQNASIRNRQPDNPFSKPSKPIGTSTTKKGKPQVKKPTYQTGGFGAGGGSRYNSVPTKDRRYS